jgi:glycine hydroxymethyltransferase
MKNLQQQDSAIYDLIKQEEQRQHDTIRLIPSENYVSSAVLEATGSILTNKYSEGYPRKRYYEGQQFVDEIEILARKRAKALFGAEHANVQPYSGSPANMAVYMAVLQPGDKVMGLSLDQGGHLTHGSRVSFSGKIFNAVGYSVDKKTHRLDMDAIRTLAKKEQPKMIIAGTTAYPREVDFAAFADIAREVGAFLLCDIAHIAGLVAAGEHQSPVPVADAVSTTTHKTLRGPRGAMIMCKKVHAKAIDKAVFPGLQGGPHNHTTAAIAVALGEAATPEFKAYAKQIKANARALAEALIAQGFTLITGGTDNHLILIDTMALNIPGKIMAKALDKAGIETNFNTIPFDSRSPFDPSGVRLGTPSVTSRGMKQGEMKHIATWMKQVSENLDNEDALARIGKQVKEMCASFPAPGIEQ